MAVVTEVTEAREPRLSTVTLSGRRVFHVYFDEFSDYSDMIPKAAAASFGGVSIPQRGTNFDGEKWQVGQPVCTDITCELYEAQNAIWEVTCTFEEPNDDRGGGQSNQETKPWKLPVLRTYSHSIAERLMMVDLDGNAIQNSAGDDFDTPITRTVPVRRETRRYNRQSFNESNASATLATVSNSDKTLCVQFDATEQIYVDPSNNKRTKYWAITEAYDTITSPEVWDTWQGMVKDTGLQQLKENGKLDKIKLEDGFAVTPQNLNGDGLPLKLNDGGTRPIGAGGSLKKIGGISNSINGVWLRYIKYK